MKSNLTCSFSMDRESNSILIQCEFGAGLDLVWQTWTTASLLDIWWAPKPYHTQTKSFDFRTGGTWLYAMVGPDNDTHWCRADYQQIQVHEHFSWVDAFCDEDGNPTSDKPGSSWTITFSEENGNTQAHIMLKHDTLEDMEAILAMGFKEGFESALQNLDELLDTLRK